MVWAVVAIVAVLMLVNFPRATLSVAGIVVGGFLLMLWTQEQESKHRRAEEAKVLVQVDQSLPSKECTEQMPIHVLFINGSNKTLQSIRWNLEIRQRGHSTDLTAYYNAPLMDLILKPGDKAAICLAVPKLKQDVPLSELEPRATVAYVNY